MTAKQPEFEQQNEQHQRRENRKFNEEGQPEEQLDEPNAPVQGEEL